MKLYLNRKFLFGFLASVIIILLLGLGSFLYILNVIDSSKEGARSQHVILLAEEIRSLMTGTEIFRLAYARTSDPQDLQRYENSLSRLQQRILDLDSLVKGEPVQASKVAVLREAHPKRDAIRDLSNAYAASVDLDAVSRTIADIQAHENRLRRTRQASITDQFYQFAFTFSGLLLVGLFVPFALGIALNINAKERALYVDKLAKANETIQDLYDRAPCGYFSLNRDGIVIRVNKTFLEWLGYKESEAVDKLHVRELFRDPETITRLEIASLEPSSLIMNIEGEVRRKNKSTLKVGINASAVADSKGMVISSRCTMFDLTELKRAEEEIRRTNLELEAFSYSVSHDLRAPLRSINGFAKVITDEYGAEMPVTMRQYFDRIASNAVLMGQLIDDLLDFARMGKKEVKKSSINLDEFVTITYKELLVQEEGRKISVNMHPMGTCVADQAMLKQVWINLISNALKYTGKKEAVEIEIGKLNTDDSDTYFIRDNGIGFDMKSSSRLFGVFQRLHKKEDFDGTGVGLALVKRIVERHEGKVWAEAKLNEGATFYFTLPHN